MRSFRRFLATVQGKILLSAILLLALILVFLIQQLVARNSQHEFNGIVYNPPLAAPAFAGIDQMGQPFQIEATKGKITLLFFGYTHCPDVCPLTMGQIATVYRQLGEDAKETQVVFASTDPERDTPAALNQFIALFDASFVGVQIPQSELAAVLQAYGGLAEKDPLAEGQTPDQYTITHSNWVYAIDRAGNLRLLFSVQLPIQQFVDDIRYLIAE